MKISKFCGMDFHEVAQYFGVILRIGSHPVEGLFSLQIFPDVPQTAQSMREVAARIEGLDPTERVYSPMTIAIALDDGSELRIPVGPLAENAARSLREGARLLEEADLLSEPVKLTTEGSA